MWSHLSITHNSPRGLVVAQVVPLYVALAQFLNYLPSKQEQAGFNFF